MENDAVVVETRADWIKVRVNETAQSSGSTCAPQGCSQCASGCGTKDKVVQVWRDNVLADRELHLGERVILAVDEARLLQSAVMMFCIPLLGFLIGASLGQLLSWSAAESLALAGLGLAIAVAMARGLLANHTRRIFQIKPMG